MFRIKYRGIYVNFVLNVGQNNFFLQFSLEKNSLCRIRHTLQCYTTNVVCALSLDHNVFDTLVPNKNLKFKM